MHQGGTYSREGIYRDPTTFLDTVSLRYVLAATHSYMGFVFDFRHFEIELLFGCTSERGIRSYQDFDVSRWEVQGLLERPL